MSRALRRHPSAKQAKARGKAARVVPRTGTARPAPHHAGRSGFAAVAGWRPRFLMDIISELRKVVWPSRQEAMHLTMVVVIVSALLGALLGGIDIGFGWLIDNTLLR
ncbi:MAG: preprotein translocase subunit SecE [Dehalococcoidia bacterium]|nr:preprotein translocase subunit SecE [Dehalococcoidia bacterium]